MFLFYNYWWCNIVGPDADQIGITDQEGRALRGTKRFGCFIGFFGAFWVAYWMIYAYMIGVFGGHRSIMSHGWIIGTIGRMLYYNFLMFWIVLGIGDLGRYLWHWQNIQYNLYLDIWLIPYIIMQFAAWFVGDGIHLILDIKSVEKMLGTYGKNNRKQY